MSYLGAAFAFFLAYFLCSWGVIYYFKPKVPRNYFLMFLIMFVSGYIIASLTLLGEMSEVALAAFFAGLVAYVLACFTMWNFFYSILWGFSGGLLADFCSDTQLLTVERIVSHYQGSRNGDEPKMDRMLRRRVPPLVEKGYVSEQDGVYKTLGKGKLVALLTLFLYWFFALGKGGGVIIEDNGRAS